MPVQPYDNCPCESGKKLRFCCQKVAKYAERAEEMLNKGQFASAVRAIDEGLAVEPQNLWLRTTKVQMLLSTHEHDAARPLIEEILRTRPGYRPVLILRLHDELAHAAVAEAIGTLQEIIDATSPDDIEESLAWMVFLGRALAELDFALPALAHLRAASRRESLSAAAERDLRSLEREVAAGPWLREEYELRPAPSENAAQRWSSAIALATNGRWQRALAILETIAQEQPECADVWFNLGLCQGWLAQNEKAVRSLERYVTLERDLDRAADALALAQSIDPRASAQTVDVVQIRYPIRDHSRLLQRLKDHPRFLVHMLDAERDHLGEGVKDEFYVLDKDSIRDPNRVTLENLPAIVGVVRTRGKDLELEFADPASDDPRPGLTVEAAGDTIEPDGNRSVIGTIPLSTHRLRVMWGIPRDCAGPQMHSIRQMLHEHRYLEVWQDTPSGWLRNQTPREAAQNPELKLSLRAAVLVLEYGAEVTLFDVDFSALRRRLGLDPEPCIEGAELDVDRLPLSRLRYVRVESLHTPVLSSLFERATRFALPIATEKSAAALLTRESERDQFNALAAFLQLTMFAQRRGDRASALKWIAQGRRWDADSGRKERAIWDIVEWEQSFQFDDIHEWATRLGELIQKMQPDKEAFTELILVLIRLGIMRPMPDPSDQNRMIMDTRILEQILTRFATPRGSTLDLTPVGGQPGKIWTPGGPTPGGESAIVLPGQESAAKPRSKLVIPGS